MPDINLFGKPGFPEIISEPDPTPVDQITVDEDDKLVQVEEQPIEKKSISSGLYIFAAIAVVAIFSVIWYSANTIKIKSHIEVYTPEQYQAISPTSEVISNEIDNSGLSDTSSYIIQE